MAAIAPMEEFINEGVGAESIPLECVLCPKKPTFSDISHLLTHVSSKSHLHQKFSLELKSKSEAGAREVLQRYAEWYDRNGIEILLAERLAAKSSKRPSRRVRSSTSSAKSRKSSSTINSLKSEFDNSSGYNTPDHVPHAGHWDVSSHGMPFREGSYIDESAYQTPLSERPQTGYFYHEGGVNSADGTNRSMASDMVPIPNTTLSIMDTSLNIDLLDEEVHNNKLKGIVWPGMALFDSATPDQKRMRNQRKDGGVIEQMKLTSEAVMATETVWGPDGAVFKVRDIYASPSIDGSPPSTPPPRKRKQSSRSDTPTRTLEEPKISGLPKRKRTTKSSVAGGANGRQTKIIAKPSERLVKKRKTNGQNTSQEAEIHGLPTEGTTHDGSFSVFYEGSGHNADDTEGHLGDIIHGNGFEVSHQNRPALQQLDPNMAMAETSSFFKSTPSNVFFDGADASHLSFRPQSGSYGSGLHSMTSNHPMASLSSQPRNAGLFQTFESQLFGSSGGSEGSAVAFHSVGGRRMGFDFDVDANDGPFGDTSFSDQSLHHTTGLFEM